MGVTADPKDPRLSYGSDEKPRSQDEVYIILSDEERAKGFVRPVRRTYTHVGDKPKYPISPLTEEQKSRTAPEPYVAFEEYPESESPQLGRYWKQADLDRKACGETTTMSRVLAETWARDPQFYGSTYCATCRMHRPVNEFVWEGTNERLGS